MRSVCDMGKCAQVFTSIDPAEGVNDVVQHALCKCNDMEYNYNHTHLLELQTTKRNF